jgi:hypothetical protein
MAFHLWPVGAIVLVLLVIIVAIWMWYHMRPQLFVIYNNSTGSELQWDTAADAYAWAQKKGYKVATQAQMQAAYNAGASMCVTGWFAGNYSGHPQQSLMNSCDGCGSPGINAVSETVHDSAIGLYVYGNKYAAFHKLPKGSLYPWNDLGWTTVPCDGSVTGCPKCHWYKPLFK